MARDISAYIDDLDDQTGQAIGVAMVGGVVALVAAGRHLNHTHFGAELKPEELPRSLRDYARGEKKNG